MTIQVNPKTVGIGVLTGAVLWHLAVALMPSVSVSGLFMAKPTNPGYAWVDTGNADSRFFWQTTNVHWKPGLPHPDFKCEASEHEPVWNPMPGYVFVDKAQGLNTVWKKQQKHPDFMAWSNDIEGQWKPVTGYKFVYEGDRFVATVWEPNKRYDDVKVISMTEKDQYKPFPGYIFIEPGQSLKVVWMPGTVNSDNSRLIAGAQEGSWIINSGNATYRPQYARRSVRNRGRDVRLFLGGMATGVVLDRIIR